MMEMQSAIPSTSLEEDDGLLLLLCASWASETPVTQGFLEDPALKLSSEGQEGIVQVHGCRVSEGRILAEERVWVEVWMLERMQSVWDLLIDTDGCQRAGHAEMGAKRWRGD